MNDGDRSDWQVEAQEPGGKDVRKERRDYAARMATDRRNSVENEPELSNTMIARGLTPVKDNLLVIRMDVAGLTQWGSSCPRERVYGRGGIRKSCGNLWKSQKPKEVNSPDRVGIFDRQLKVESKDA